MSPIALDDPKELARFFITSDCSGGNFHEESFQSGSKRIYSRIEKEIKNRKKFYLLKRKELICIRIVKGANILSSKEQVIRDSHAYRFEILQDIVNANINTLEYHRQRVKSFNSPLNQLGIFDRIKGDPLRSA